MRRTRSGVSETPDREHMSIFLATLYVRLFTHIAHFLRRAWGFPPTLRPGRGIAVVSSANAHGRHPTRARASSRSRAHT